MTILSTERKIPNIIETTTCGKHRKAEGFPCYIINAGEDKPIYYGVCGVRIRKAGYVGVISSDSLRLKSFGGPNHKRKS